VNPRGCQPSVALRLNPRIVGLSDLCGAILGAWHMVDCAFLNGPVPLSSGIYSYLSATEGSIRVARRAGR
jgi:hypothetical protein